MKTKATWTAMTLIAALAAGPAAANDPTQPPGDPALEIYLSQGRTSLPIFVVGAETLMGFELDGEVSWTANNQEIAVTPLQTANGEAMDVEALGLLNDALVCAEVRGWLSLGGDMGREVVERECVIYERDWAPVQPALGDGSLKQETQDNGQRRPGALPVVGRR